MRITLLYIISLLGLTSISSQTIPVDNTTISILTCGTGDQIYAIFGHSAIRVQDPTKNIDWVFNYGTFDFDTPNFIPKFLRGKLLYQVKGTKYDSFLVEYQYYQRDVREQVLNLSTDEKKEIIAALTDIVKPENRDYLYDFFFDNCVTRLRDLLSNHIDQLSYPQEAQETISFRGLLHSYTPHMPWTQFGMDLILGAKTDKITTVSDQMFLPEYFESFLDQSSSSAGKLISSKETLLAFPAIQDGGSFLTPSFLFGALLVFELILFLLLYISGESDGWWKLDQIWFIGLFICAVIFLFMWFLTDHQVCKQNWNLLWTAPWMALYYRLKENASLKKILIFLTILSCLIVLFGQSMIPQEFTLPMLMITAISLLKGLRLSGIYKALDKVIRHGAVTTAMLCVTVMCMGQEKIGGLTVVAPPRAFETDPMPAIKQVNANWIALVPYAFNRQDDPEVYFGSNRQWWGERKEGIIKSIELAQAQGLKIMLKPQVWMRGTWVGEMDYDTEEEWKIWEESYKSYIMLFVDIAIERNIEMLCVGTEFRIAVQKREQYWRELITDIKSKYKGKLTYSANWDSYEKVPFWDQLDFIGLSAYFPLSDFDTPNQLYLSLKWRKIVSKLSKYSKKHDRPILFTEYGYLSVDGAAGKTWELEKKVHDLRINEKAQANALAALYNAFWDKDWWQGGFLWKWFPNGHGHEGYPERDYTPQGKLGQEVLSEWYGKTN